MKETRDLMGMHVTVDVPDIGMPAETAAEIEKVFAYFAYVDEKFSTYKKTSEISKMNRGELRAADSSQDMQEVLALAEATKKETDGYFDIIAPDGSCDPSGLVKGWAIRNAGQLLLKDGITDFYVDAGGDIQVYGKNAQGGPWRVGIKNPANEQEIVKVVYLGNNEGIATSGTYVRGQHIYDPKRKQPPQDGIVSLTVIGPDVYEADRFATAAFAMGRAGIAFIEQRPGLEGYMIDGQGLATMTSGFQRYTDAQTY